MPFIWDDSRNSFDFHRTLQLVGVRRRRSGGAVEQPDFACREIRTDHARQQCHAHSEYDCT